MAHWDIVFSRTSLFSLTCYNSSRIDCMLFSKLIGPSYPLTWNDIDGSLGHCLLHDMSVFSDLL
jgi:hypothetical protein